MTFLEDSEIRLRAVNPEDSDMMWQAETDSSQWIENQMAAPLSRQNLREYAASYDADPFRAGQLRLIIERKSDACVVGIADLYDISAISRRAFVGIYIFPRFRRNGFAKRALTLLAEYSSRMLNLRLLAAKIAGSNETSMWLFETSGYKLCGTLPYWIEAGGYYFPLNIYVRNIRNLNT